MGDPADVFPIVVIQAGDDGAGIGAKFRAEGVRISFEREDVAARADDFIFVDGAFVKLGDKDFPNTGGTAGAHGMDAAVPTIEIAHHADALCAGSPNGEVHAPNAFECNHVGAEFFVSVVVAALAHEIEIKLAEYDGKGIGIEDFKGITEVRTSDDFVASWGGRNGLVRGPCGFEETFGAKFNRAGNLGGSERGAFSRGRS